MSSLEDLNSNVARLISAVLNRAAADGLDVQRLRGIATFDREKDAFVMSVEPFAVVEAGIRALPLVAERLGADESQRLALQFVYEYIRHAPSFTFDPAVAALVWSGFVAELESPIWVTRSVANLRHFHSDVYPIDLGDGVSVRGRSQSDLLALGFAPPIVEALFAQWGGFGSSAFVLVAESSKPKRPEELLRTDSSGVWLRSNRAMGAMRLTAPGDIAIGTMYFQRAARFNVGLGGIHSNGTPAETMGSTFTWSADDAEDYAETYAALAALEQHGYRRSRGNLDLALRAFMSTYDHFPSAPDIQLVDAITALEAVFGDSAELSFKLSFRVASLLAATDDERVALLKQVRGFYDARSKVVHGSRIEAKQRAALQSVDDLRNHVRRLLRGMVHFAASQAHGSEEQWLKGDLDAALVHTDHREQLRRVLGLT